MGGETVPLEADVTFDSNGILTPGITHALGAAGVTLTTAGTYEVTFSVSGTEPSQMALFVNGTLVPGAVYGSGAGTQQNLGRRSSLLQLGPCSRSGTTPRAPRSASRRRLEGRSRAQMLP